MDTIAQSETRERLLDVAEDLFSRRGYASVRLRDIAQVMGMKHASLYYYAPGGKKQLFIEVMERNFARHRQGLTQAIAQAPDNLRAQLYAVAYWLVHQPPLDFARLRDADMPEIDKEQAENLMETAFDAMRLPIVAVLIKAKSAGDIALSDLDLAAMTLVSLLQSVHNIPEKYAATVREHIGKDLVDMLLDGWLKR